MINFNANYATVDITNIDRGVAPRFVPFPCCALRFVDLDCGLNLVLEPVPNNRNIVMFEIDLVGNNNVRYHCGGEAIRNSSDGMYCSITFDRNKAIGFELSYSQVNNIISSSLVRDHVSIVSPNPGTMMNHLNGAKTWDTNQVSVLVPPQPVEVINAMLREKAAQQAHNFNPTGAAINNLTAVCNVITEQVQQEARTVSGKCPHHRRGYTDKNGRTVGATIIHPELFNGVTK